MTDNTCYICNQKLDTKMNWSNYTSFTECILDGDTIITLSCEHKFHKTCVNENKINFNIQNDSKYQCPIYTCRKITNNNINVYSLHKLLENFLTFPDAVQIIKETSDINMLNYLHPISQTTPLQITINMGITTTHKHVHAEIINIIMSLLLNDNVIKEDMYFNSFVEYLNILKINFFDEFMLLYDIVIKYYPKISEHIQKIDHPLA